VKVIFLDVDYVLNHEGSKSKFGDWRGIDSYHVKQLKKIVNETNAILVLSSSWRLNLNYIGEEMEQPMEYLKKRLGKYGLHISSVTPNIKWNKRGEEIKKWLDDNNDVEIESFVILDDEEFDYKKQNLLNNFVRTTWDYGLTEKESDEAIKILGVNE